MAGSRRPRFGAVPAPVRAALPWPWRPGYGPGARGKAASHEVATSTGFGMKTLIAAYSGVLRDRRLEPREMNCLGHGYPETMVEPQGLGLERQGLLPGDLCLACPLKGRTGSSILSALQDLFSITWLNRSKVEKQLQVISVLQWVLTFLVMGVMCSALLMYTFCTDCWLLSVLYFTWLAFDWNTPKKGGRRSQWVRNWAVWRYFRDYFPIQVQRGATLGGRVGGSLCGFWMQPFRHPSSSEKFPGIRPYLATLAGNFRMPLLREYLMSGGICPVNRDTIDYLLSKNGSGNAIIIVVGGAAESLSSRPGKNAVTLRNRKGFVKLALRHGADLVPTYSFGENEVYKQVIFEEGSWGLWVQQKFQKYIGFAPCIFHGRGFFSSNTWGLVPYSKPITTVVGEPITIPKLAQPAQKDIDLYHAMYVEALVKLFDNHKTSFGLPETEVLEVN
ncbi:diacylglycerol O-acyltransferase 2 [Echinops telfairi]|uniref:Diacylglycerol O-acyltransferase 2 n=1 Tax=Echinops telfairi TaxID=9371 RepID=A0AC55DBA0_ECHTE|nr:diacylglycerol O-acyltransferase 2 [Echinops telfairi]